jgi:ABC-type polysaccharide/polyol phosphate transport system ATPase subunit
MNTAQTADAPQSVEGSAGGDAIVVSHVTKRFRIQHKGSIKQSLLSATRRTLGGAKPHVEQKLALNDVSFTVPHGQTVAVIGRNGSGKSTLMGLLAHVYLPTSGSIGLYNPQGRKARIAPLLELGAGFHPDLTGSDNVEFYGAVLGLTGEQVARKYDQIVDFAELRDKMDTTVRNWNDGARLRLGFSIAVNIDPDILLVDEVLAVGDEAFQNKCYQLIAQLQAQGKTILFVSHDLAVVERVASRIIWLHEGVVRMDGDMPTVLREYRQASARFTP